MLLNGLPHLTWLPSQLLMYLKEEEAFWLFVQLMYGANFRKLYGEDLSLLRQALSELDTQLEKRARRLHAHLSEHGAPYCCAARQDMESSM